MGTEMSARPDSSLFDQLESPPAFDSIITIARLKDPEVQAELIRKLSSGPKVQQIRSAIREEKPRKVGSY